MDQGDDQSGEWVVQRRGHVTALMFGKIVRRRAAYVPLVERLLYSKTRRTKAMQHGHDNEPKACDLYGNYLCKFHHQQASAERTGFHIDYQVCTMHQVLVLTLSIICSRTGWVHHQMAW